MERSQKKRVENEAADALKSPQRELEIGYAKKEEKEESDAAGASGASGASGQVKDASTTKRNILSINFST